MKYLVLSGCPLFVSSLLLLALSCGKTASLETKNRATSENLQGAVNGEPANKQPPIQSSSHQQPSAVDGSQTIPELGLPGSADSDPGCEKVKAFNIKIPFECCYIGKDSIMTGYCANFDLTTCEVTVCKRT